MIILIDEYDVPLENAYLGGFYQEMVYFIRSLFETALKGNLGLYFTVITGCLVIIKESPGTGGCMLSRIPARYPEWYVYQWYVYQRHPFKPRGG